MRVTYRKERVDKSSLLAVYLHLKLLLYQSRNALLGKYDSKDRKVETIDWERERRELTKEFIFDACFELIRAVQRVRNLKSSKRINHPQRKLKNVSSPILNSPRSWWKQKWGTRIMCERSVRFARYFACRVACKKTYIWGRDIRRRQYGKVRRNMTDGTS